LTASLVTREDRDGVAVLTIDNPPVNALGQAVRRQLLAAARDIEADSTIKAVVLTGQGRFFVGGADIREFDHQPEEPHLPDVIDAIDRSSKPWIAAVNGPAIGGGAELALGCHYRVMLASAAISLPETQLGIIPGAGGTQRLPRLIGVEAAVDVVTSGRSIKSDEAIALGLADHIAKADCLGEALAFAAEHLDAALPVKASMRPVSDPGPDIWAEIEKHIAKTSAGNRAPAIAMEAVREGVRSGFTVGSAYERDAFLRLRQSPEAAALRYLFFAERSARRSRKTVDDARNSLGSIGVVGGGTMGSGIAAALAIAGLPVILAETNADRLDDAMSRIAAVLASAAKREAVDAEKAKERLARVSGAVSVAAMADCNLVIEAVFEDLELKKSVFSALAGHCKPDAILATNTSYLNPEEIVEDLPGADRFIALHFFSPAHVMKLLEVIPLENSSEQTLTTCLDLAGVLGKVAILCGNMEGFIGNRILRRYRAGAERLLLDGYTPAEVDGAMRSFGFKMGPFEAQDLAGLDIAFKANQLMRNPGRPQPMSLADRLASRGRFGQKSRAGWYDYEDGSRTPLASADVAELIRSQRSAAGRTIGDIAEFLLGEMVDEGEKLLASKVAARASDIDLVQVHGFGFPRTKGGPMHHATRRGRPD
jgi:3-hydroxyacyl-CoA dehydrogenase